MESTIPSECTHTSHDACEWTIIESEICSHDIFLTNDDGDDVTFWLRVAAERVELRHAKWLFEDLAC